MYISLGEAHKTKGNWTSRKRMCDKCLVWHLEGVLLQETDQNPD